MKDLLVLVPTRMEQIAIFGTGNADPTVVDFASLGVEAVVERCGFGPVAAGILTKSAIALHRPKRVVLIGIAGSYEDHLAIGSAYTFDKVVIDGIGVRSPEGETLPPSQIGFPQVDLDGDSSTAGNAVYETLEPKRWSNFKPSGTLLTTCSCSANESDVRRLLQQYPGAVAEDMEGFSVALACQLAGVQLEIIRGISNVAGDRNKKNWQIKTALEAAGELLNVLVRE